MTALHCTALEIFKELPEAGERMPQMSGVTFWLVRLSIAFYCILYSAALKCTLHSIAYTVFKRPGLARADLQKSL